MPGNILIFIQIYASSIREPTYNKFRFSSSTHEKKEHPNGSLISKKPTKVKVNTIEGKVESQSIEKH